jgi:hypothetical protein
MAALLAQDLGEVTGDLRALRGMPACSLRRVLSRLIHGEPSRPLPPVCYGPACSGRLYRRGRNGLSCNLASGSARLLLVRLECGEHREARSRHDIGVAGEDESVRLRAASGLCT